MPTQALFGISVAFGFVAWGVFAAYAIWPDLRDRSRVDLLRPLLILHSFRFIGLSFLVPGVVSPDLPPAFAIYAGYGDIIAATLALLSLAMLGTRFGIILVWIFNVWGSIDLLNAFYLGNATGLLPGQLGASFFIPTAIVPLLMVTHALVFWALLRRETEETIPRAA